MTELRDPRDAQRKTASGGRGRELAALVRSDREAARTLLAGLSAEEQARAVGDLPAERRADALSLVPDLGPVVRRMPEIDVCATMVAFGPDRSGWILAHATPEQVVACFDLDVWRGLELDPEALDAWLLGLSDAGDAALLRAARVLDSELLALWARRHLEFYFRPGEDEDWEPPDDTRTLDGEYHFRARRPDDDLEVPLRLLHLLFENDQPLYLALVYDAAEGSASGDAEQALRWRSGRLVDLGFPLREEALAAYAWLDPETSTRLTPEARTVDLSPLPATRDRPLLPYPIFEAIAALPPEEREQALLAFMVLSNKVLVAEQMSLGDADAVRRAMERAAELASRGLDALAERNGLDEVEVVRRLPVEHLFRVGANLTGANGALLKETTPAGD